MAVTMAGPTQAQLGPPLGSRQAHSASVASRPSPALPRVSFHMTVGDECGGDGFIGTSGSGRDHRRT
eukprot:13152252-Alexandrium_andersonii.AAC.1